MPRHTNGKRQVCNRLEFSLSFNSENDKGHVLTFHMLVVATCNRVHVLIIYCLTFSSSLLENLKWKGEGDRESINACLKSNC